MKNELSAINVLAISKATKKAAIDAAKKDVTIGTHAVNVLVRVRGTITLGEDYEQEFWQIAKPEHTILALVCALNGTTADKITQEQYERVLADVEKVDHKISDDEAKRFKSDREKHLKTLRKPTLQTAQGKLTAKVTVESVGENPADLTSAVASNEDTSKVTPEQA